MRIRSHATLAGLTLRRGFAAVLMLAVSVRVGADTVTLADGAPPRECRIVSLSPDAARTAENADLPMSSVVRIEFSAFRLPAKANRLVLVDGSVLSGRLGRLQGTSVCFRSSTFGWLDVPADQVAAVFYGTGETPGKAAAPDAGQCRVLREAKDPLDGQLMWADQKTVAVLANGELTTLPADSVCGVVLRPAAEAQPGCILRNGDRLARFAVSREYQDHIVTDIAGLPEKLPIQALKELAVQRQTLGLPEPEKPAPEEDTEKKQQK